MCHRKACRPRWDMDNRRDARGIYHIARKEFRDDNSCLTLSLPYPTAEYLNNQKSFESYYDGELVGGLYGVSLGAAFFGESMFATMTDASKVCLAALVDFADANNFLYIDAQQETQHLASLGAQPISKEDFLSILFLSNQVFRKIL